MYTFFFVTYEIQIFFFIQWYVNFLHDFMYAECKVEILIKSKYMQLRLSKIYVWMKYSFPQ